MFKKKKIVDEKILMKLRCSRKWYLPIYLMIAVVIGLVVFIIVSGLSLNKYSLFSAILFVIFGIKLTEVHRLINTYELTENYLIYSKGLFTTNIKRIFIPTISDLILDQTPWQRMLNFGSVDIRRYAEGPAVHLKNIDKPGDFIDLLEERLQLHFPTSGGDK